MDDARAYLLRATRGNRTRRLLCTKQVPRLLGLGGNGGEGGTRTRICRLQGGGSSFELRPQISQLTNENAAVEKAGLEPASAACHAAVLPLNYNPRVVYRPAGCEGIEPSRRSFGGSAVTMTLHPIREAYRLRRTRGDLNSHHLIDNQAAYQLHTGA